MLHWGTSNEYCIICFCGETRTITIWDPLLSGPKHITYHYLIIAVQLQGDLSRLLNVTEYHQVYSEIYNALWLKIESSKRKLQTGVSYCICQHIQCIMTEIMTKQEKLQTHVNYCLHKYIRCIRQSIGPSMRKLQTGVNHCICKHIRCIMTKHRTKQAKTAN